MINKDFLDFSGLNIFFNKLKTIFASKNEIPTDYIVSGSQTTTSSADGGSNVYTFTDTSGKTSTITVKNGSKGSAGSNGTNGKDGISISKVEQTTTSTADGGTNICTVTLTNGNTYTFSFKNGSKGSAGAKGANGTSSAWFAGTAVTGTSTSAVSVSVSGSKAGDMYLNTSTCNVYRASAANSWVYVCNIKGQTPTFKIKDDGNLYVSL